MTRARAMAAALVLGVVVGGACGASKRSAQGSRFLGDTHHARGHEPGASDAGVSPGERARSMTADQARAALATAAEEGDHILVVHLAQRVLAAGDTPGAAVVSTAAAAIDALSAAELRAVYDDLDPARAPAPLVALRLALVAEHMGDDAAARTWLERAASGAGSAVPGGIAGLDARVQAMKTRIRARDAVDPAVIAVLLPRTGRFARLGAELEAGVRFAEEFFGREHRSDIELRLVVVDTGGDPAGAVAAVDRAVFEHGALAILGPVGQDESVAAAARAAELGVPIGLLAPGRGASVEAGVYRLWTSPQWETREAVRLAVELGYDRLAVLAPRDEHGGLAMRVFAEAAAAYGVSVVAQGQYDPTSTALEDDIKAFLGLDPATNARLRRHLRRHGKRGWKSFSPDVPFDLLYIPDQYDRAALVASYLPYFNVEVRSRDVMDILALKRKHRGHVPQVVQLLGSSGWHHASLIPRGGPAVEGALVVDVYSGGANEEFATEEGALFAQQFEAWAGRPPSGLIAQAFDAALLVLRARERVVERVSGAGEPPEQGRALRQAFVQALADERLDAGACGPAAVGADGHIQREAILLRVDSGAFVLHAY